MVDLAEQVRDLIDVAEPIALSDVQRSDRHQPTDRPRRGTVLATTLCVAAVVAVVVAMVLLRSDGGTTSKVTVTPTSSAACGSRGRADELSMNVNATEAQIAGVRAVLDQTPNVAAIRFMDHAAAYAEFKCLFAANPDLVRNVDPAALPVSYRFRITDATYAAARNPRHPSRCRRHAGWCGSRRVLLIIAVVDV